MHTLKETRPSAYSGLETLYHSAVEAVSDPQYERAAPTPKNETIDTWGIEMFYFGISRGYKLARCHMREEEMLNASCEENSQTFGNWRDSEVDENDDKTV